MSSGCTSLLPSGIDGIGSIGTRSGIPMRCAVSATLSRPTICERRMYAQFVERAVWVVSVAVPPREPS